MQRRRGELARGGHLAHPSADQQLRAGGRSLFALAAIQLQSVRGRGHAIVRHAFHPEPPPLQGLDRRDHAANPTYPLSFQRRPVRCALDGGNFDRAMVHREDEELGDLQWWVEVVVAHQHQRPAPVGQPRPEGHPLEIVEVHSELAQVQHQPLVRCAQRPRRRVRQAFEPEKVRRLGQRHLEQPDRVADAQRERSLQRQQVVGIERQQLDEPGHLEPIGN